MNITTRSTTLTLIALLLLGPIAACNTAEGLGKDVSAVGTAVSDTAEGSKGY